MKNEEEQKCNNNQASAPVETRVDNQRSVENENTQQFQAQNFMVGGLTGASPPKFVSFEEIMKAANGMTNMALAHEIALDKNFKLETLDPPSDSFQKKVKETMHNIFWQLLAQELAEDPPNYNQALTLLGEIKTALEELLLPRHTKIRENINEVLDVDFIKQQAEQGILDFHHYANFIISIMAKLCAPVRDENIAKLAQSTDVIETFRGILETLQLMKLDMANFTITLIRPEIVASSVEYEKKKFAEFLKVNEDGLQLTRKWLLRNLDMEKLTAPSTDINAVRQITHSLLTEAYLDLLEWKFNPDAETLMMDQGRLVELRDRTCRLCITGTVLLVTNNTIGAPLQGVTSFKNNVKQHLAVLLESVHSNEDLTTAMMNIVLQVTADVKETLKEVGASELSPELESLLSAQLIEIAKPDHKIRHLVNIRIRQFLQKIIQSQTAGPQQIPPGLSSLQEELAGIAAQFLIIVSHNRSVFGEYYLDIVTTAISGENAATPMNTE
ncbi:T-complex protein 11-like protein 1 isoform X2 [Diprion similis]|nr:T-complex protein 11-like protein 1 isoform X2 [Diprion similis]XP_046747864.1 T-complex protein 11-like protein 1 isoform X2 [Diprion similis]XP_046747865.1 T-complex protein 11-like protein 1 isoform X2 [Diprion similis]XP_046747866.1 T-complex protein 11-like protein 1 isoform X2 [Diprion similis]